MHVELFAANVAYAIIVSDCLINLGSTLAPLTLKIAFISLMIPFSIVVNLKIFSYSSTIGILAIICICGIVIVRGAQSSPPSWINPDLDSIRLFPSSFLDLASGMIL